MYGKRCGWRSPKRDHHKNSRARVQLLSAPRMDFADACAVVLVSKYERAFVLTNDFRDFSAYRVAFASPEGAFYV